MPPRDSLRGYTERLRDDIWPPDGAALHLNDDAASALMERVREQVRALRPIDDGQKWQLAHNQVDDASYPIDVGEADISRSARPAASNFALGP